MTHILTLKSEDMRQKQISQLHNTEVQEITGGNVGALFSCYVASRSVLLLYVCPILSVFSVGLFPYIICKLHIGPPGQEKN